jgi:environmental stress-induced protein Ves
VIRHLRAADRVAVPWKNGGGVTREVAIWPEGSGFDDFDWRISIAEVRDAGPFSKFENIDRTLMILEGRLSLVFCDRVATLDPDSAPFGFGGEEACAGTPLGGAVMDLNVMVRRGRRTAQVRRVSDEVAIPDIGESVVVAPSATTVHIAAHSISLAQRDALLIPRGHGTLSARDPVFLIVLS